jgi:predicted secreted protein
MLNFRLEETVVFKSENIFLLQIFFYKEKITKIKKIIFEGEIFSKISARNAQFQTRRNSCFQK